ncbi:MAG: glycogen synthase [Phycisphaerales bacterium]|nr:glycogen synthase [Phycisphaerales bacterium]
MRVALACSEAVPFAKTGGLADVAAGLSRYLADIGQDVRVFLPLYGTIDRRDLALTPVEFLQNAVIPFEGRAEQFSVLTTPIPDSPHSIYFVDCPQRFGRNAIYASDGDEHLRFGTFCRAVIQSCQHMGWAPDIIHCHDWHTALIPLYLRSLYEWDNLFSETRTVLTIHNLAYQGLFPADVVTELGLDAYRRLLWQDDLEQGRINFLKMGIVYADAVTTVSRTYADEIRTEGSGCGLHELLQSRSDHLFGIVNGVDYGQWDPATDPLIEANYTREDLAGKKKCKTALLREMGLRAGPDVPTLGMVTRLTAQKGIEILYEPLSEMLGALDVRLIVLGSGEERYESFFTRLESAFRAKMCFYRGFQNRLAHMIEAGCDMFLMPSRFEPCGLNQMYSLKYGTVPIVHRTGGLADTVEPWDAETGRGTGFVFEHHTPDGARWAIGEALRTFGEPTAWRQLIRNGMAMDYSWSRQGRAYLSLFARLCDK